MPSSISLLTGVPRSGTTLACKLLNSADNIIALHEPLNPQSFSSTSGDNITSELKKAIDNIYLRLLSGKAIEHGDHKNLILDNPISEATLPNTFVRRASAKRGLLKIPAIKTNTRVFIKQNAMFAALVNNLKSNYELVAIIRNPIDVLTSWMTVDLPVNKGHIPAGEKFCPQLKKALEIQHDVLQRQLYIYKWFLTQYNDGELTIIKYEDIISSKGLALFDACNVKGQLDETLTHRRANYPALKEPLASAVQQLNYSLLNQYYSKQEIEEAYYQSVSICGSN